MNLRPRASRRTHAVAGGFALVALATLTACGSATPAASQSAQAGASATTAATAAAANPAAAGPAIVATTNVYAAVAQAIAGDSSEVTAILSDPAADPHDFEVTPADKLAMSKAAVVIVNGGGYDDWATTVIESLDTKPAVVNAFDVADYQAEAAEDIAEDAAEGDHDDHDDHDDAEDIAEDAAEHAHAHGDVNEHVFYDIEEMEDVAEKIAAELTTAAPANRDAYAANLKAFTERLDTIEDQLDDVSASGFKYIATEPVAKYLLDDAGGIDATPAEFSQAIESGNDPSVAVIKSVNDLITSKQVQVLVYNAQTSDQVTDSMKDLAATSGVGVVAVTETLPEGVSNYADWMDTNVKNLAAALQG